MSASKSLQGHLVEFDRRPIDPHMLDAFVLAWGDDLTLLQIVNTDLMATNGYSVIRNADVRRWRYLDSRSFLGRALKLKGITPTFPCGLAITNWSKVLETAGHLFPLLTLQREKINSRVCYVGRVSSMTEKIVTLKKIDPDARWGDAKRYRFRDLTRVDFGGGYESALAMVAAANKGRRS